MKLTDFANGVNLLCQRTYVLFAPKTGKKAVFLISFCEEGNNNSYNCLINSTICKSKISRI